MQACNKTKRKPWRHLGPLLGQTNILGFMFFSVKQKSKVNALTEMPSCITACPASQCSLAYNTTEMCRAPVLGRQQQHMPEGWPPSRAASARSAVIACAEACTRRSSAASAAIMAA